MIVGLSGYAQVGKDTAAQVFERHGFKKYSFADPMRKMAEAINPIIRAEDVGIYGEVDIVYERYNTLIKRLGYEAAKRSYPEIREFLQRLGTDAGREVLGKDIWVNTGMTYMLAGGDYVVADVRFPNEAELIQSFGGHVFRIERPGYGPANDHESERAMDNFPIRDIIINAGTIGDLHQNVWDAYMNREVRT